MKINTVQSPNFKSIEIRKQKDNERLFYEVEVNYTDNINEVFYYNSVDQLPIIALKGTDVKKINEILQKPLQFGYGNTVGHNNDDIRIYILEPLIKILKEKNLSASFTYSPSDKKLKPENIFSEKEKESLMLAISQKISKINTERRDNMRKPGLVKNEDILNMSGHLDYLSIKLDIEA